MTAPERDLLDAIRTDPDSESPWLNLARWFEDNGRDDEAVAVRVFRRTLSDSLAVRCSLETVLDDVRRNAGILGACAGDRGAGREVRKGDRPSINDTATGACPWPVREYRGRPTGHPHPTGGGGVQLPSASVADGPSGGQADPARCARPAAPVRSTHDPLPLLRAPPRPLPGRMQMHRWYVRGLRTLLGPLLVSRRTADVRTGGPFAALRSL